MIILDLNKVNKDFGFGNLFEDVSFAINEGERIAIVGNNGCGKSTLLKIISGQETSTSGVISIKKGAVVQYLEQGDKTDTLKGKSIDILKSAFTELYNMEQVLKDMEQQMCDSNLSEHELSKLISQYSNLQERFLALGGYEIDTQNNYVESGLKINKDLLDRDFETLSGGERTLINFAKILLSKPDLLLLDEPTNHLDIGRIEWLESYINDFKGTIIIVSHDRYFLDKVAKKVIEIENGKVSIYVGNYTDYLRQKENEEVKEFQIYKVQQKKIEEMEKAIKRLKEWGKMSDNPMFFRRAKAIQTNLDRLRENAIDKPTQIKELPINFESSKRGSEDVVIAKDLDLKIGDKHLLQGANVIIKNKEKVAIIGDNGTGKSTFIKTLLSDYARVDGVLCLGSSVKVGYLPQIIEFDDDKQRLLDYFINNTNCDEEQSRSKLFNFQFFKKDIIKRVGNLSGGEKLRLKLAVLLQQDINTLIFDEPTNHIDIHTREVLEETLTKYNGTLIFVSHDRFFINRVANKVIEFKNKKLYTFNGNYDDYINYREKEYNKIKL